MLVTLQQIPLSVLIKLVVIVMFLLQGPTVQGTQVSQTVNQNVSEAPSPVADNSQVDDKTSPKLNARQNADRGESFQKTQITQYWILVATGIITTIAVMVYTVFAVLQWWQIKKQAKHTSEQVDAMQQQLALMQKSTEDTKEAFYVTERAYLAITKASINPTIGVSPIVQVAIINGGRTPAWDIWVRGQFSVGSVPLRNSKQKETDTTGKNIISILTPLAERTIDVQPGVDLVFTPEMLSTIEGRAKTLFFCGEICYRDITGEQTLPVELIYRPDTKVFADFKNIQHQ
jgi:hypothetical protein